MAWKTGSSSEELEMTSNTWELAACCSRASASSRVSTANVVWASLPRGLRELRGIEARDADLVARAVGRVTMIERHVDDQEINCAPRGAATYMDAPGLT